MSNSCIGWSVCTYGEANVMLSAAALGVRLSLTLLHKHTSH